MKYPPLKNISEFVAKMDFTELELILHYAIDNIVVV